MIMSAGNEDHLNMSKADKSDRFLEANGSGAIFNTANAVSTFQRLNMQSLGRHALRRATLAQDRQVCPYLYFPCKQTAARYTAHLASEIV